MTSQRDPDETAYRLLTESHTLLVLDTETTPAAGGGSQRLIQLGTVPVTLGRRGRPTVRLVNPGEPITNSHIHRITDADVHGKPDFARVAPALDALLTGVPGQPPVVLVAHYANYDVAVLRGEYQRLDRDIPDLPVLDTIALARHVGHDTDRNRSLPALARSLGIEFTPEHDAGKDAVATARCLVALLRKGAEAGLVDLDHILATAGSTTLDLAPPELTTRPEVDVPPELPAEHLATHAWLLPAAPTGDDLDRWVAAAIECARLRCPLARDRAATAVANAPEHVAKLLPTLTRPDGLATLEAGQAGTHVGTLVELVPTAFPKTNHALIWRRKIRAQIAQLPRCDRSSSDSRCPDCQAGLPCPLDTLHQTVAHTECHFTEDGHIVRNSLSRLLEQKKGGINLWATTEDRDVAGYAAWLVIDYLEGQGGRSRATNVLDRAVQLGLDATEPRLALLHAQALLDHGQLDGVESVLAACSRPAGNTDDGYDRLNEWAAGPYAEARASSPRPQRRPDPGSQGTAGGTGAAQPVQALTRAAADDRGHLAIRRPSGLPNLDHSDVL